MPEKICNTPKEKPTNQALKSEIQVKILDARRGRWGRHNSVITGSLVDLYAHRITKKIHLRSTEVNWLSKYLSSIWLGIKSGNITFDKETECDIQEIRQLLHV